MLRSKDLDQLQILNIKSSFRCIHLGGTYIESVQPVLCLQNTRDTHNFWNAPKCFLWAREKFIDM